jgi:hypothetical protein
MSLLLLNGCLMTSDELRADPHEKGSISISMPYSVAFANLVSSANECFPARHANLGALASNYTHVSVEEIARGRLAKIEGVTEHSLTKDNVFVSIDVRAIQNGTEIDYYVSPRFFGIYDDSSSFRPIAEAWANGDGTKCS